MPVRDEPVESCKSHNPENPDSDKNPLTRISIPSFPRRRESGRFHPSQPPEIKRESQPADPFPLYVGRLGWARAARKRGSAGKTRRPSRPLRNSQNPVFGKASRPNLVTHSSLFSLKISHSPAIDLRNSTPDARISFAKVLDLGRISGHGFRYSHRNRAG